MIYNKHNRKTGDVKKEGRIISPQGDVLEILSKKKT